MSAAQAVIAEARSKGYTPAAWGEDGIGIMYPNGPHNENLDFWRRWNAVPNADLIAVLNAEERAAA